MVSAILASLTLFGQAFGGSWICTFGQYHTPWHIYAAPGRSWTVVEWGPRTQDGGTAYVGKVPARGQWLYEDFHFDGSYSQNASPGPVNGSWSWTGSYYIGKRVLHGVVIWKRSSANSIDRTFEQYVNGRRGRVTHDVCAKQ